jgi:uncharacterized protein YcbK (DUF882 family)
MVDRISLHFRRAEFACKCGCGFDTVDTELLNCLETLRTFTGKIKITSGCRCGSHNRAVGGKVASYHLQGRAVDIIVESSTPGMVYDILTSLYTDSYGIILYPTFVHFDTRTGPPYRKSNISPRPKVEE